MLKTISLFWLLNKQSSTVHGLLLVREMAPKVNNHHKKQWSKILRWEAEDRKKKKKSVEAHYWKELYHSGSLGKEIQITRLIIQISCVWNKEEARPQPDWEKRLNKEIHVKNIIKIYILNWTKLHSLLCNCQSCLLKNKLYCSNFSYSVRNWCLYKNWSRNLLLTWQVNVA